MPGLPLTLARRCAALRARRTAHNRSCRRRLQRRRLPPRRSATWTAGDSGELPDVDMADQEPQPSHAAPGQGFAGQQAALWGGLLGAAPPSGNGLLLMQGLGGGAAAGASALAWPGASAAERELALLKQQQLLLEQQRRRIEAQLQLQMASLSAGLGGGPLAGSAGACYSQLLAGDASATAPGAAALAAGGPTPASLAPAAAASARCSHLDWSGVNSAAGAVAAPALQPQQLGASTALVARARQAGLQQPLPGGATGLQPAFGAAPRAAAAASSPFAALAADDFDPAMAAELSAALDAAGLPPGPGTWDAAAQQHQHQQPGNLSVGSSQSHASGAASCLVPVPGGATAPHAHTASHLAGVATSTAAAAAALRQQMQHDAGLATPPGGLDARHSAASTTCGSPTAAACGELGGGVAGVMQVQQRQQELHMLLSSVQALYQDVQSLTLAYTGAGAAGGAADAAAAVAARVAAAATAAPAGVQAMLPSLGGHGATRTEASVGCAAWRNDLC
jgi:hypothetical protein